MKREELVITVFFTGCRYFYPNNGLAKVNQDRRVLPRVAAGEMAVGQSAWRGIKRNRGGDYNVFSK
jgi:hypothetical protein